MIETVLFPPLLRCAYCQAVLTECPEFEYEDWIVRCFGCGVKNLLTICVLGTFRYTLSVLGWRE